MTQLDFNGELHARPSIYFKGYGFVEHVALKPPKGIVPQHAHSSLSKSDAGDSITTTQIELHTEFVTVTRVTRLEGQASSWPTQMLTTHEALRLSGFSNASIVCRVGILVHGAAPKDITPILSTFDFADTAASKVAADAAVVCSDFRVRPDHASRILLFNSELNAYRLGRMVRRLCEIETYRAMAFLALPEARRLTPMLTAWDDQISDIAGRLDLGKADHKEVLNEISSLSAEVISAAARNRSRFGATEAYANIVEERIGELRETHLPGFQRFGVFVHRRFRPAVRTCVATARRLDQLSSTTTHMIDLLQTRIQLEIEYQNATQIKAMAERASTQIKIQKAVEGFSVIAISYYLIGLLKTIVESAEHANVEVSPMVMLVSIPIILAAVAVATKRVKKAIIS
jgi:uncharacterized membrane-anchored protein